MDTRLSVGRAGERTAARHYEAHGYRILHRNYRVRSGELDLVAYKCPRIVFVEVKSRSSLYFWECEMPVSPRKLQRLRQLARIFLFRERAVLPNWREARIDLVLVTQGRVKRCLSESMG